MCSLSWNMKCRFWEDMHHVCNFLMILLQSYADYLNPFHAYDEGNLSWLVTHLHLITKILEKQ